MKYRITFWMTAMTLVFFLIFAEESKAQEALSFEQLQLLVEPGDKVYVTNSKGVVTEGKITELSSSVLRLKEKNAIQDFIESDVSRIRQWRHDSLLNGTLIGTGIAGTFALIGTLSCGDCGDTTGQLVASGLLFTGMGAALGAGIDALIRTKQTIYIGRTRVSLNLNSVRPILTPSRKGASISLSF